MSSISSTHYRMRLAKQHILAGAKARPERRLGASLCDGSVLQAPALLISTHAAACHLHICLQCIQMSR